MNYNISKEKITIMDNTQFNPKHIFECGQVFRYKKTGNNYTIISEDKKAVVTETENGFDITTNEISYFVNYFDLKTDYDKIKYDLSKDNIMEKACKFGSGIRILNQSPFETIISFIISANNNIKRIQGLIEKLSTKCGTKCDDYYAFPTLKQLSTLSESDLRQLGMGFRAKYIYETSRLLSGIDLEKIYDYSTENLLAYLKALCGVGPKVADCIALFAYHKMDCFPVDVWVEKIYNCFFANEKLTNRSKIRSELIKKFGINSGYAQQYLFYYKREMDKISKN